MPFALVQMSLDQTIDREALEDAGVASKSIPRPDCAKSQKELFGIVIEPNAFEEEIIWSFYRIMHNAGY
jgi:hypothetical protein